MLDRTSGSSVGAFAMSNSLAARAAIVLLLLTSQISIASAAEPSGCAAFKWPVDRERALLTAAAQTQLSSGADLTSLPTTAIALSLRPTADAALPTPPERPPAPDRFAGFLRIKQIAKPGAYTIALSTGGWVDVVQDGHPLKPIAFSGATDCDGIRKLVRYELTAGELLLQLSGVGEATSTLAIIPAD
jgi:hypothetical protein